MIRDVAFVHLVNVWCLCDVHQVSDSKVLDLKDGWTGGGREGGKEEEGGREGKRKRKGERERGRYIWRKGWMTVDGSTSSYLLGPYRTGTKKSVTDMTSPNCSSGNETTAFTLGTSPLRQGRPKTRLRLLRIRRKTCSPVFR